jgi:precorrin-6B methylase 2
LRQDTRWPVLYHLSEERQNIVSWLPLKKTDRVLEIGCGCGAITGALCRRAGHVDAVEISPRRAEIAAWRNKDCANLRICVGNLNDLALGASYDVVTLIGVLEYAVSFTHTQAPFHDFLVQCQQYLKPGGTVITNCRPVKPTTATLTGSSYDGSEMIAYLRENLAADRLLVVDGQEAIDKLGSPRVLNMVLLGAAIRTGQIGLTEEDIKKAMGRLIKPAFMELNLKAFDFARQ